MKDETYLKELEDRGINKYAGLIAGPILILGSLFLMLYGEPTYGMVGILGTDLSLVLIRLLGITGIGYFLYMFLRHLDRAFGIKLFFEILGIPFLLIMAIIFDFGSFRQETAGFFDNFGINSVGDFIRDFENYENEFYANEFANLSCTTDISQIEGNRGSNIFGREVEILSVFDGREVSREEGKLVCAAIAVVNPSGEKKVEITFRFIRNEYFVNWNIIN